MSDKKNNSLSPIQSVTDYINAVEKFADGWTSIIYRGQSNTEYELSSSAYRKINGGKGATKAELYKYHEQILLESRQLADAHDSSQADFCQLAHLQHHGAPTVLLDYSYNPLVALYFACQESSSGDKDKNKDGDGAVYCFNHSAQYIPYIKKEDTLNNIFNMETRKTPTEKKGDNNSFVLTPPENEGSPRIHNLFLLEPPHINQRILAQQSILLLHTEGKIEKNSHYKIVIDTVSKKNILNQLRLLGISQKTLFPDTPGFAKWFTQKTGVERYEQLLKEANKAASDFARLEPSQQNNVENCDALIILCEKAIGYAKDNEDTIKKKSEIAHAILAHAYAIMNDKIDKLKELHEEHLDNNAIAVYYSLGLGNLAEKQALPESTKTVEALRLLLERFPNNDRIAQNYSWGLGNLAEKQELPESTKTVELVKQLHERFPDNNTIAEICSRVLASLAEKQELPECTKTVALVKQLHERFPNNERIAGSYSAGLVKLTAKQKLQESTITVETLKQLHERFQHNEQIADNYSYGLVNLTKEQELQERANTVESLKKLHERFPNNEWIAELYKIASDRLPPQ